jgi:hypothetical protein
MEELGQQQFFTCLRPEKDLIGTISTPLKYGTGMREHPLSYDR